MQNISNVIKKLHQNFSDLLFTSKIEKYIQLHEDKKFNIATQSTDELQGILKALKLHILQSKDMRSPQASVFKTHINMELLQRGEPPSDISAAESATLLRWWYLHMKNHPSYTLVLNALKNDIFDLGGKDFLSKLLTDKKFSQEDWGEVISYFANHYETYLYREQNRFIHCDVSTIPTDLVEGQAALFGERVEEEYVLNFCYALLSVLQRDNEDMQTIHETMNSNLLTEIQAIQNHGYHNTEINRLCDFFINAHSPWRTLYIQMDFKENPKALFKESDLNFQESEIHF